MGGTRPWLQAGEGRVWKGLGWIFSAVRRGSSQPLTLPRRLRFELSLLACERCNKSSPKCWLGAEFGFQAVQESINQLAHELK